MSTEQILLLGYAPMAAAIALLFKLLMKERADRLTFVEKKLEQTEGREDAQAETIAALTAVSKAQQQGALPPPLPAPRGPLRSR